MGIEVQKSALPTLFNFARVRAASQPHLECSFQNILSWTFLGNKNFAQRNNGATSSSASSASRGGGDRDDIYTSMEALHSYNVDNQQRLPAARKPRVKVLPDFDPFTPKPSRTNPNVMFKRPSSMSSLVMY